MGFAALFGIAGLPLVEGATGLFGFLEFAAALGHGEFERWWSASSTYWNGRGPGR